MIGSLVFLTPRGALLALTGVVPLAALALAAWRERRAREALRLPAPGPRSRLWPAAAVVAIAALLGLAASQPVLRSKSSLEVRTDAQAFFVIDVSRSMLAARAPGARTRITQARKAAIWLRSRLPDVPSGIATMTDRVLPDLLPVSSRSVFDQTIREAVAVDQPPPSSDDVTATTLGSLGVLGTQSFFVPSAKHRVAIVLTDGESRPFDVRATARALAHAPGVTPIFVQISSPGEDVFDADGKPEAAYHPDGSGAVALAGLARAAKGESFGEGELGRAAAAVRTALGTGPTKEEGFVLSTTTLAPWAALAALVPLLFLVWSRRRPSFGILRRRRRLATGHGFPADTQALPVHDR